MKSVVVEASTVAKAIEIAWHKAEKPEEFFIRILQEHQFGFLGFGSQKAKIVLFFKNSQKSDSAFPVVVKQKEYANLFNNSHLKVPTQLNVVDQELNKNVILGNQQKNKQNKFHQQDKKSVVDKVAAPISANVKAELSHVDKHAKKNQNSPKTLQTIQVHFEKQNVKQQKQGQVKAAHISEKHGEKQAKNQPDVKLQQVEKSHVVAQEKKKLHDKNIVQVFDIQKNPAIKNSQRQIELQISKAEAILSPHNPVVEQKDDVVKDIARALKKVQSQKIVSNVSRSTERKNIASKVNVHQVEENVIDVKPTLNTVASSDQQAQIVPKAVQRFKRRPLAVDATQPSGIGKKKSSSVSEVNNDDAYKLDKNFLK